MCFAVEGLTTKKLVEEVKQATVQSIVELKELKQEFSELHHKVEKPAE